MYYSFFDTAVNGFLIDATGADIRRLDAVGLVAETQCEFLRELRFPADVHVGLSVERLGTSSIVYRLGLFQGEQRRAGRDRPVRARVRGRAEPGRHACAGDHPAGGRAARHSGGVN